MFGGFPRRCSAIYHFMSRGIIGEPGDTILDRVMSSHASSVKSLIHTRRQPIGTRSSPDSDLALVIAMSITPGFINGPLPFAMEELEVLKGLCHSIQLRLVCQLYTRTMPWRTCHLARSFTLRVTKF